MSSFVHHDFLLTTDMARMLFNDGAALVPIYDFHCHLDVAKLAADAHYENLTELWVASDPYKHRAMRIAGVPERCITGDVSDQEKFSCWASVLPQTLGNPLFAWSALELNRTFGTDEFLSAANWKRVWTHCNDMLQEPSHTARGLLGNTSCKVICTSDNLLDNLSAHAALAGSNFRVKILPSLRGDDLLDVSGPAFGAFLHRLGTATGINLKTFDDWKSAVCMRLDLFSAMGCRVADHGIDTFAFLSATEDETAALFLESLHGRLCSMDQVRLQSGLLHWLAAEYARRGWALQLHLGAQRSTSTRLRQCAGRAGGFAGIGNAIDIPALRNFLDALEQADSLPKTILYPLHPGDYPPIATLSGSFTGDGVRGKVQLGPAWWYNDHALGMRHQLDVHSSYGLLSTFVGMTTDSRSQLSIHRHEYFRRVLCSWLGDKVSSGEFPADEGLLRSLVQGICGENARVWLNLEG